MNAQDYEGHYNFSLAMGAEISRLQAENTELKKALELAKAGECTGGCK